MLVLDTVACNPRTVLVEVGPPPQESGICAILDGASPTFVYLSIAQASVHDVAVEKGLAELHLMIEDLRHGNFSEVHADDRQAIERRTAPMSIMEAKAWAAAMTKDLLNVVD